MNKGFIIEKETILVEETTELNQEIIEVLETLEVDCTEDSTSNVALKDVLEEMNEAEASYLKIDWN